MHSIHTIGHSTLDLVEFLGRLQAHDVRHVVDVRRYPGSHRFPQFGRDALAASLATVGIGYTHAPDLGGRRAPHPDSPNTGWRSASFRAYADHMGTPAFRAALERVLRLARAAPVAIMCAEAVPWRCHRQLIADTLVASGHDVRDILSSARAEPHRLNPMAQRAPDGTLVYSAAPDASQTTPL